RSRATAKASCAHSSARSMSPKRPMRTDTTRPYSRRNTCSTWSAVTADRVMSVLHRAHLDRQPGGGGQPARPAQGLVEVVGPDAREAADVFLALGVGPVGGEEARAVAPDDGGGFGRTQAGVEDPAAGPLDLLPPGVDLGHHGRQVLGRGRVPVRLVDAEQVLPHPT